MEERHFELFAKISLQNLLETDRVISDVFVGLIVENANSSIDDFEGEVSLETILDFLLALFIEALFRQILASFDELFEHFLAVASEELANGAARRLFSIECNNIVRNGHFRKLEILDDVAVPIDCYFSSVDESFGRFVRDKKLTSQSFLQNCRFYK